MIERGSLVDPAEAGHVAFRSTGEHAQGEFRCAECGYGITVLSNLPSCPMCRGTTWETSPWGRKPRVELLL